MRISTQEFLLGSIPDMLAQQANASRLNREIASGQTMLDAGGDPAGAAQALLVASNISQLTVNSTAAQAAQQSAQTGISALQQVATLVTQLQQVASQAGNAATTSDQRSGLIAQAQSALQQLIALANTQGSDGRYIFGGSQTGAPAFQPQANGTIAFNGDDDTPQFAIAPSLSVPASLSGRNVFSSIPAGIGAIGVGAGAANTGSAYAVAQGVTNIGQVMAESRAGTQFAVRFSTAADGSLAYSVTSGSGDPSGSGFSATSGVIASGTFTAGSDLMFGGIDLRLVGAPAAGDSFVVRPGSSTSLFQTVQNLIAALATPSGDAAARTQTQQQVETVLAQLGGAQTSVLSAQATLGATLSQIQGVQQQLGTQTTDAQAELTSLQSANLPQVIASYSETVTALQAAQLAFARLQGLSLFSVIGR